ncbi:hypothetical protein D3C78_1945210 [compost metagenome]
MAQVSGLSGMFGISIAPEARKKVKKMPRTMARLCNSSRLLSPEHAVAGVKIMNIEEVRKRDGRVNSE